MPKYKTYHGRSRFHGVKVALLTVLLAGLAAFFIFVVPNYIAYDADGNISLDLPFLSGILRPPAPTVEPSPTGVQLVIESPPPHGPGSTDDTDGPSPTPERPPQFAGAQLFIPAARLNVPDMTDLRDKAAAEDFSGVIIEYKREGTGGSGGDSNLTMAPETAETVMEVFAGSGLELTALISVGVDNEKPRTAEFTAFAVKHVSGQNFMDRNGNRWLDMYRAEVHTLAIDLSREALAAGFDRVLLSNVGFPHGGGTDRVLYGAAAGRTPNAMTSARSSVSSLFAILILIVGVVCVVGCIIYPPFKNLMFYSLYATSCQIELMNPTILLSRLENNTATNITKPDPTIVPSTVSTFLPSE